MTNVPALRRGLAVLRLIAERSAPVSAASIEADLDLPRSTVYHLLVELREAGFVRHLSKSRKYTLGPALQELAARGRERELRMPARPRSEPPKGASHEIRDAQRQQYEIDVAVALTQACHDQGPGALLPSAQAMATFYGLTELWAESVSRTLCEVASAVMPEAGETP